MGYLMECCILLCFFEKRNDSERKLSSKTIETGFRWERDKDLLGKVVYSNGKEDLEETR